VPPASPWPPPDADDDGRDGDELELSEGAGREPSLGRSLRGGGDTAGGRLDEPLPLPGTTRGADPRAGVEGA